MTRELSLAWGELLIWQGNGEQLQSRTFEDTFEDDVLTVEDMRHCEPERWRRKPKTRTLTVWTYRYPYGTCRSFTSDTQEIDKFPSDRTLIDTHTFEVVL